MTAPKDQTSWVKSPPGTAMQLLCGGCRGPMPAAGRKRMWVGRYARFCCAACQAKRPHLIISKGSK